jgi:putative nucleotidyltransferase with HDIG domain
MAGQIPLRVADIVRKKLEIPTPPLILTKVMQALRDPQANADHLAKVVSADQGLASRMLRIANSPFYGLPREVVSIHQAVVILGFMTIQGLAISVSSRGLYKRFGAPEQALWEHSLAAAIVAHRVAQALRLPCREEAFVAGLMHDVGKVVMNNEGSEAFEQAVARASAADEEPHVAEQAVFGFNHMDVGSLLVRQWQLSQDLEQVVFLHHDLDLASSVAPDSLQLIALADLADRVCWSLGLGTRRPLRETDFGDVPACAELGIDADDLAPLIEESREAFEAEKQSFALGS